MGNTRVPVLLPIDMQRGFDLGERWPPRWNTDCDANGRALLAHWRNQGWPIVHVRHDSTDPESTLRPGQPGNEFRAGFEPLPGERVIGKSVNAAFIGTDLDAQLRSLGATELFVFGISTDQCVSTTIRVGANTAWVCTLVQDACDCFDLPGPAGRVIPAAEVHAVHIATLAFEFCRVVDTSDAIEPGSAA